MSKFKELAAEFGFLAEDQNKLETQVAFKLEKAKKMDEVETVTFGLETDDNKIVKVYVKADEADDFEKALSKKLGTEDSIEAALNDLSKDFEIVDVEWPELEDDDDDEDDTTSSDKPDGDGSDALNKEVYQNEHEGNGDAKHKSKHDYTVKQEQLSIGQKFASKLIEEDKKKQEVEKKDDVSAPIIDRLKTENEKLVYHAILELGIPEHALNKSSFKTAILKGIRNKAEELENSSKMRNSVRAFLTHSIDEAIEHRKPLLNEASSADDFMTTLTNLINYLDASDGKRYASQLQSSMQYKSLLQQAKTNLDTLITAPIKQKLEQLEQAMEATAKSGATQQAPITESLSIKQFEQFFGGLLTYIDPTDEKQYFKNVQKSQPYIQYLRHIQSSLATKTGSTIGLKLNDLINVLNQTYKQKGLNIGQPQQTSPAMQTTQGPQPTVESLAEALDKWSFEKDDDDNTILMAGQLKVTLNDEAMEKLNKAIKNHVVLTVHDQNEKDKFIFSPRGKTVVVKKIGFGGLQAVLREADVEQLLGLTDNT